MNLKLAAAMVVAILMSAFAGAEVDRSTPENTVKSLIKAVFESKYDDVLCCVKDSKPNDTLAKMFKERVMEIPAYEVKVTDVHIDGTKATCTITTNLSGKGISGQTIVETAELEQIGGSWLVVAPKNEPKPGHIVNSVASFLVKPEEMFVKAKGAAKKAACLSNIKQLATAFMMVAADNDDFFKVKANAWKKALMPYVKNEAIFTCPLDPKGTVSYSINPAMAGLSATAVKDVSRTVLLYEGSKGKLNFRHGGYAAVAFVDGHAKMVNAEEAKSLIWKP